MCKKTKKKIKYSHIHPTTFTVTAGNSVHLQHRGPLSNHGLGASLS